MSFKSFKSYLNESCDCWKGYKRKPGTKPCAPGSCVKEEVVSEGTSYEKSEENKRSADDAKKQGDMFAHHLHMADYHDNLAQWHSEKGRHGEADRHAEKSEQHHEKAMELKESIDEAAVDAKGYKSSTGGLTQKGRDAYNRAEGSNLKAPVTTPPSKLKAGSKAANRRKSFCARMSGVEGPMKKPNGEPTRKALALRKWNC